MKHILSLLVMAMMLAVPALAIEETGEDHTGNPYLIDESPGVFGAFTVVDGYVLADTASWAKSGKLTSSEICWRNQDGGSPGGNGQEHNVVIYQLFHLPRQDASTFDYKVGELTIRAGERKCLDVPEPGDYYFRQAFYSVGEQNKCKETYPYYTAGCNIEKCGEGKVLRQRGLQDVVPNGCSQEGWVAERCEPAIHYGYTCEGADRNVNAGAGDDGSGGDVSTGVLRGEWQEPGIPTHAKPDDMVTITGTFEALADGRYYLEAGIVDTGLFSTVTATQSQCDSDPQFAGDYVDLGAGESASFVGTVDAPEEEGKYSVVLGAYTGCLSEGGEKVNTLTKNIEITNDPGAGRGDSTGAGLILGLSGAALSVGLLILVVLGAIVYVVWRLFKK